MNRRLFTSLKLHFKPGFSIWFILIMLAFARPSTGSLPGLTQKILQDVKPELHLRILRVRKISLNAYFPDIILYKGSMFISYREACAHSDAASLGRAVILKSDDDGESWKEVAILWMPGADLRDPHFCILADGRLMLNGGIGGKQGKGNTYLASPDTAAATAITGRIATIFDLE